jgi:hypothetical protein
MDRTPNGDFAGSPGAATLPESPDPEPRMLEIRCHCECCGKDLAPDADDAWICSFECTFCTTCVEMPLAHVCPNCGGGFERRPKRAAALLAKYPPSMTRRPLVGR